MIETITDFYVNFPQFSLINHEKHNFKGTLIINNFPINIKLELPNFPIIKNFKCLIANTFMSINLEKNLNIDSNLNIEEFLLNFLPEHLNNENLIPNFKKEFEYGKKILNLYNEIIECKKEINNTCKMYVNEELTSIKFDNIIGYDGHYLQLRIKKFLIKIEDHSLPNVSDDWNINTKNDDNLTKKTFFQSSVTILEHLKQFLKLLDDFQLFYKYINTLDDLCWIVEPTVVTLKHNWRMFKLIDNIYIKVIINPLCPNSINVNLYGPTSEVEKYHKIYSENIYKWDADSDIYNNLLKIFDLMLFPCHDTSNMEIDEDLNCKICLCYLDDNDHVPICSCDNSKCNLVYHISCLKKWFASSADGRTFLDVTIGKCPYCKEKLSASFIDLLDN